MELFEAIPKQWGNSIGITIPREIVKEEKIKPKKKIKVLVVGNSSLKEIFGSLKLKKSAQEITGEIDEGYD